MGADPPFVNMVKILVADDHTIVRVGIRQILEAGEGLEVAAEAQNGAEILERVRRNACDLLLLDMSIPGEDAIDIIRQVQSSAPRVRILALSEHEHGDYAARAIRAGASGWLTKDELSAHLVDAVRSIAAGGAYFTPQVAQQLALGAMPDAKGPPHAALSDREFQIFRLIAEGKSISDIAERLELSVKTVSTHKTNILQKMGMSTQADLIRYALAHHLVEQ